MNYQELSPQGETLLKEIIDLQASGQDNAAYWSKRFDGLSMQQDTLLRDTFRELRECGYVKHSGLATFHTICPSQWMVITISLTKRPQKRPRENSPGGNGGLLSYRPSLAVWLD